MIKYIKRQDLDVTKYDACIEKSLQSRIYAFSWYLDIVSEHWDVLILDDYEAVMPIPWRKKFFFKLISQPLFCQQLGVFSNIEVSTNLTYQFITQIPTSFKICHYQFNAQNNIVNKELVRKNYILDLNTKYVKLRANYRKDRKYRINQVKKKNYELVSIKPKEIISIAEKNYKFMNIPKKEYEKLALLMNTIIQKKMGFILGIENNKGEILGGSFFIKSKHRITYLFSAMTEEGKYNQVASLIIDNVINEYSKNLYVLDFEGSMIKGVASFYKSFGADFEEYKLFKYNNLPWFLRLFKK